MYNIAVVDDDYNYLTYLSRQIIKYNASFKVTAYHDPSLLLEATNDIDVLFIDYELSGTTAFDFLETIPDHDFLTIIVSNHDSVVYRSFKYKIFWFIRKSNLDEELRDVLPILLQELKQRHHNLKISSYNKNICIPMKSINYIEKSKNNLIINADKIYTIRYTYSKLITEFDFSEFITPLYGVIVNPDYIRYIDFSKNMIKLNNDITFNISRKYKKETLKKYQEYIAKL